MWKFGQKFACGKCGAISQVRDGRKLIAGTTHAKIPHERRERLESTAEEKIKEKEVNIFKIRVI